MIGLSLSLSLSSRMNHKAFKHFIFIKSSNKDVQEFTEPDETYQCNECPGQFKYQKSFLKHMENYHQKNASQICPKTPKKHNKLAYSCKYCDKSYTSEKLLNKHIICHGM